MPCCHPACTRSCHHTHPPGGSQRTECRGISRRWHAPHVPSYPCCCCAQWGHAARSTTYATSSPASGYCWPPANASGCTRWPTGEKLGLPRHLVQKGWCKSGRQYGTYYRRTGLNVSFPLLSKVVFNGRHTLFFNVSPQYDVGTHMFFMQGLLASPLCICSRCCRYSFNIWCMISLHVYC
jgi:hypothetical protein